MPSRSCECFVLEVGGQRYGLPSSDVVEVLRAVTVTPLPKAPAIVEGVINVRGTVVPVLDIRSRFRLPAKALSYTDHLAVARVDGRTVALRVDRAWGLLRINEPDLMAAEELAVGSAYVAGVAKLPDGLVLIHDLRTFLSQAESVELDAALLEPGEGVTCPR